MSNGRGTFSFSCSCILCNGDVTFVPMHAWKTHSPLPLSAIQDWLVRYSGRKTTLPDEEAAGRANTLWKHYFGLETLRCGCCMEALDQEFRFRTMVCSQHGGTISSSLSHEQCLSDFWQKSRNEPSTQQKQCTVWYQRNQGLRIRIYSFKFTCYKRYINEKAYMVGPDLLKHAVDGTCTSPRGRIAIGI